MICQCLLVCVKHRTGIASVDYGELMKQSFSLGPPLIQRFANAVRYVFTHCTVSLTGKVMQAVVIIMNNNY